MGLRWRTWVWGALPSVVGYGVCLAFVAVPTVLLVSRWDTPPQAPSLEGLFHVGEIKVSLNSTVDSNRLLREGGPAVFAEVADGRWRERDMADPLTAAHPPDLSLVGSSQVLHFYRGNGTGGVRALVVIVSEGRLTAGWVVRTVGETGWFGRGLTERNAPLPLLIGDEREVFGDDANPDCLRLDYRLGLLSVAGPLGTVCDP